VVALAASDSKAIRPSVLNVERAFGAMWVFFGW
jgi:hypothetical protein